MDSTLLKKRWRELRTDLLRHWSRLDRADLDRIDGDHDRLRATLRERYGYTEEEADRAVHAFDLEVKDLEVAARRMEAGE
jgi:hypothetical protein